MLGDHFWPAMYPGIIIGFLVGLSAGGFVPTLLGAIGGLAGGMALYFVGTWLGIEEGIALLAMQIAGVVVGAYLLMMLGRLVTGTRPGPAS